MYFSDTTLNQFTDRITDKELVSFFNIKENKKLLLNDIDIDFSRDINSFNVLQFDKRESEILDAHIWTYQFYNKQMFSQYGHGWTPGQPQTGYIYNLATNVPKEVLLEIQKINPDKFLTIKVNKSNIFLNPSVQTKMYLLKGDIIELLETRKNWLHIRFYGKKNIEGWIKKSDVE